MSNEPYANARPCLERLQTVDASMVLDNGQWLPPPPKPIAKITLCGCIHLTLTDEVKGSFIKPTPEQIKNLKEMLCIDIELLEEEEDA